jgi:CheY-like chemotaxis protein
MRSVSDRTILVVDEDAAFRKRLTSLVEPFGVRVETVRGEDEVLEAIGRRIPEAVVIAVDLPEKEGYGLFSKVKKARRRVPVALVTSTISAADLKLHEKLKVHAEVYLDKRTVTDEELREAIATRLGISRPEGPPEEVPAETPSDSPSEEAAAALPQAVLKSKAPLDPWLAELLDPETTAILEEIDEEPSFTGLRRKGIVEGEVTPERVAALEEEIEDLRQELNHARSDARSSPFSSEFLVLREEASAKDRRLRALGEAMARRDSQVAAVKEKLADFARRFLDASREADRSREQVSDLKGELEAAQGKLQRLFDEVEEHERKRDEETRILRTEIVDGEARHAQARKDLENEIAFLKASHAKARESEEREREAALRALERKAKEERSRLADELKSKYGDKLTELQASHGRALAALREEHGKDAQAIHDSYRENAARAAAEAQETLRQAAEKSASALEEANRQRVAELARVEEKRQADLRESERRHRDEILSLGVSHRTEKDALSRELEAARTRIERIAGELGVKIEDMAKDLEEERTRHQQTRERYERELEALQTAHSSYVEQAEQDQFSALAGLSRKFREDRSRFMEVERQKWEETARTLHIDHARALEGLEKQYRDEVQALAASHQAALLQKEAGAEQARKVEVEKARLEIQESFEKTLRGHTDELAALRQSHEREISILRAAHMDSLQRRDRENQQAIRDALEAVKAEAAERVERARGASAETAAAQRREHEEEIAAFEKVHQETVAKLERESREGLRRVEEERDQAREAAEGLRAAMAEMEARHRSSAILTEEKRKSEQWESAKEFKSRIAQLEEEKQFLSASIEKMKRQSSTELARALDSLAHEKKLHQSSQDRYERRLAELSGRHAEGIKQIEKEWMEKFEALEKTFNEKSEKTVSGLEREWRARVEKERFAHEEAAAALTRHFEMELATLGQQLERSRGLEESYQAAARDLTAVKNTVEELTRSLAESHNEIADRDRALQEQTQRLSENAKTIASLKAVIDDFSRSVEGYMRDREESDQTISSLKAVIDDFYRGLEGERKN